MILTTFRYIKDTCNWDKACSILGWNPWMFAEGLCGDDTVVSLDDDMASIIGYKLPKEPVKDSRNFIITKEGLPNSLKESKVKIIHKVNEWQEVSMMISNQELLELYEVIGEYVLSLEGKEV